MGPDGPVDLGGFEPLTSSVRLRRAPSCATGPMGDRDCTRLNAGVSSKLTSPQRLVHDNDATREITRVSQRCAYTCNMVKLSQAPYPVHLPRRCCAVQRALGAGSAASTTPPISATHALSGHVPAPSASTTATGAYTVYLPLIQSRLSHPRRISRAVGHALRLDPLRLHGRPPPTSIRLSTMPLRRISTRCSFKSAAPPMPITPRH